MWNLHSKSIMLFREISILFLSQVKFDLGLFRESKMVIPFFFPLPPSGFRLDNP